MSNKKILFLINEHKYFIFQNYMFLKVLLYFLPKL